MKKSVFFLATLTLVLASCTNPVVSTNFEKPLMTGPESKAISLSVADAFEQDDTQATAKAITVNAPVQERNFYDDGTDWLSFTAEASKVYTIESFISGNTDTVLYVYDGTTQKATNDDKTSSDYGSKITFTAPASKVYTIKAYSYNGTKGASLGYSISVSGPTSGGGTTPVTTYTITYNGNGSTSGSVPVNSNTYASGASLTVASNSGNLVKTGYTFTSWNTLANGTGTSYAASASLTMPASNVTLYAVWTVESTSGGGSTVFTENMSLPLAVRDYYRSAYGLSGTALKAKLQQIITSSMTGKGYSALWTMYKTTDVAPNGKVWDMYSSTSADGTSAAYWFTFGTNQDSGSGSSEGQFYNREHSWPNSTFGATSNALAYSDGHHVTPTDKIVNNKRSNYAYGEVGTPSWTSRNGSKFGPARAGLGFTGDVFEVINIYKGDHARMHFYMALRYYNNSTFLVCDWSNAGAKLKPWYDTMMRSWASLDPVSAKETARNNTVQAYQGNRNPFIDYPELLNLISLTN